MIVLSVVGPLSTVYVGGLLAVLVVPLAIGSSLAVYLTTSVNPGNIGTADLTTAFSATAIFAVYFAIMGYTVLWRNIESYFSSLPWLDESRSIQPTKLKSLSLQKSRCPFTGALTF